ncbi:MAG TPA: M15 family metallopeptidase [Victivallales bacterium]|nr:M15 family metallopeptidase [Victivallales bacterium]
MNKKTQSKKILPVTSILVAFIIVGVLAVFINSCQKKHVVSNLTTFKSSNIVGYKNKPVVVDATFVPTMNLINSYAVNNNVMVYVTSSYRHSNNNLKKTVVKPASMSNHLIGHAIDMNIVYKGKWYDSKLMSKNNFSRLPFNVRNFLNEIRHTPNIRWGGDFKTQDPVHIDDHYNKNRSNWTVKFNALNNS